MKLVLRYASIAISIILVGLCAYEYWPSRLQQLGLTAAERKYDELRARFGDGHIVQSDTYKANRDKPKIPGDAMLRDAEETNPFGIAPIPKELPRLLPDGQAEGEEKPVRVFARSRHDFGSFGYNVDRSDHIALFRALPQTRGKNCPNRTIAWPNMAEDSPASSLLQVSVIIYLYDEALSVLLRTVYSVLNRTPAKLLREIILMDDTSDFEELQKALEVEIKNIPQVRLVRNAVHIGQPAAKNEAARIAKGNILVFLCSRCEVNDAWIQPLIVALGYADGVTSGQRAAKRPKRVVAPILDNIEMNTFGYEKAPVLFAGFTWNLLFTWQSVPQKILNTHRVEYSNDLVEPFQTATFHGAVIALSTETFKALGGFDDSLESWGIIGEDSIDFSLKTWLCGGEVLTVPCSRVGYVYADRNPFNQLPPGLGIMDTYTYNTLRSAHIWFDNSSLVEFFKWNPSAVKSTRYGNLTKAVKFKHEKKCHSFDWLVHNIYPGLEDKRFKSSHHNANQVGQAGTARNGSALQQPASNTRNVKLQLSTKTEDAGGKICLSLVDRSLEAKNQNKLGNPDEQTERWFSKMDNCNSKTVGPNNEPHSVGRHNLLWQSVGASGYGNASKFIELRTRWSGITQPLCLTVSDTKEKLPFLGMGDLYRIAARACQEDQPRQVWRLRLVEKSKKMYLESVSHERKCLAVKQVAAGESVYIDDCAKEDNLQITFLNA